MSVELLFPGLMLLMFIGIILAVVFGVIVTTRSRQTNKEESSITDLNKGVESLEAELRDIKSKGKRPGQN